MDCPQDIVVYLEPGYCITCVSMAPEGLCNQTPVVTQIDGTGLTSGDDFPMEKHRRLIISDQLGYAMECSFRVQLLDIGGALVCADELHVSVAFDCEM